MDPRPGSQAILLGLAFRLQVLQRCISRSPAIIPPFADLSASDVSGGPGGWRFQEYWRREAGEHGVYIAGVELGGGWSINAAPRDLLHVPMC
jgi:hypothetical protein